MCCGSGETKFPEVKPLKRGGGRRYYRPEDVDLLRADPDNTFTRRGYTTRGVQKLLREGGARGEAPRPDPRSRAETSPPRANRSTYRDCGLVRVLLGNIADGAGRGAT